MENTKAIQYRAKPDFISRKVAGENVLISLGGNVANFNGYIRLNDSGKFLWDALQQPCTQPGLVELLEKEYEVGPEQAAADVAAFVQKMLQGGLVEEAE